MKDGADTDAQRRLRGAYTLAASRYARWVAPRFRPLARELLAWPSLPADPALDVGSGTGVVVSAWRRLAPVAELVAADLTPAMLERSRARWRVVADAAALPFAAATFRTVVSMFALHHLPDPGAALREWARVTARGGELRLATWGENERTLWDCFDDVLAEQGLAEGPRLAPRPLDAAAPLVGAVACAGFDAIAVQERVEEFGFPDVAAFWHWRTAFPGGARVLAGLPARRRSALRDALGRGLAAWPGPLVSRHRVLYLRARLP